MKIYDKTIDSNKQVELDEVLLNFRVERIPKKCKLFIIILKYAT